MLRISFVHHLFGRKPRGRELSLQFPVWSCIPWLLGCLGWPRVILEWISYQQKQQRTETRLETTMCPPSRPATRLCTAQKMLSSLSQEWKLNVPELISNFPLHLPHRCCHLPSSHLPSGGLTGSPGCGLCTGSLGWLGPRQGLCFSALGLAFLVFPQR